MLVYHAGLVQHFSRIDAASVAIVITEFGSRGMFWREVVSVMLQHQLYDQLGQLTQLVHPLRQHFYWIDAEMRYGELSWSWRGPELILCIPPTDSVNWIRQWERLTPCAGPTPLSHRGNLHLATTRHAARRLCSPMWPFPPSFLTIESLWIPPRLKTNSTE